MRSGPIIQEIVDFGGDLRRYFKIILALLRREEELRRRAPLDSFLEILEPVILLATVGFFRYVMNVSPTTLGQDTVFFLATGFFPKYLFLWISNYMRSSIGRPDRRFPIEQRLDHIIVHIILRVLDYSVVGLVLFGIIYLFITHAAWPYNFAPLFPALAAMVMLGFGWGVLNLLLIRLLWFWKYAFMAINRALIIISGALFVPAFLPPNIRYVLSFNPCLQAIELFRTGFFERYPTIVLDTRYLTYCAIIALLLGLVLERVSRRIEAK